jgi:hypothetical protein
MKWEVNWLTWVSNLILTVSRFKKQLSWPQNGTARQGCGIKTINRPEEAGCRRWKRLRTPTVEMCRCEPSAMLPLDVPKSHDIHFVQQFLHCPLQNCQHQQQQLITTQSLQSTYLIIPNTEPLRLNNCFLNYILFLQQVLSDALWTVNTVLLHTQYKSFTVQQSSLKQHVPSCVCVAVRREWYLMIKL